MTASAQPTTGDGGDAAPAEGESPIPADVPSTGAPLWRLIRRAGGYGWINYVDYRTGGTVAGGSTVGLKTASPIVGVSYVVINNTPIPYVITSGSPPLVPPIPFSALNQGFTGTRVLWRELVR